MSAHTPEDLQRIGERASEWLEVLAEKPGPEQLAEFAAWISDSPLHVREFLTIAAIDRQLEEIDPERLIEVTTRGRESRRNVLPLQRPLPASVAAGPLPQTQWDGSRNVHWRWAASIAAIGFGIVGVWWWQERSTWQEYATAVGEQNTIQLADGTSVNLNTKSRLMVRFTPQGRNVRLLAGEALFKVHHDPTHPFRVYAGSSVIQAIGTQFNVRRRDAGEVTVSVIEGKVQVSPVKSFLRADTVEMAGPPPKLAAGEQAHIAVDGNVSARRKDVDPGVVTAWREHRLVFYRATLAEIVDEFNRYNANPQIVVDDEALRARRYTVVLPANDPQSLIDYLKQSPDIEFHREGNELIVSR